MKLIRIANDFSAVPGGRYPADGPGNGTTFRNDFLVPILEADETAEIVLDGARGYPSSFLEEAFGGLVREGYTPSKILKTFHFIAEQPGFSRFIDLIKDHVDRAARAAADTKPNPA